MNDLTSTELEILHSSALNMGGDGRIVHVTVHGAAFSCCGRGWHRRDGYWQEYAGWVDNLQDDAFMLYSPGIGTISYVVALRFSEVEAIELR